MFIANVYFGQAVRFANGFLPKWLFSEKVYRIDVGESHSIFPLERSSHASDESV